MRLKTSQGHPSLGAFAETSSEVVCLVQGIMNEEWMMAHYMVTARPISDRMEELTEKLRNRAFEPLKPFGRALTYSLEHAKIDTRGYWKWEELDYCDPPLAQERKAVLDRYFSLEHIEQVHENEGWKQLSEYEDALPEFSSR
jgi:hypothetical protein